MGNEHGPKLEAAPGENGAAAEYARPFTNDQGSGQELADTLTGALSSEVLGDEQWAVDVDIGEPVLPTDASGNAVPVPDEPATPPVPVVSDPDQEITAPGGVPSFRADDEAPRPRSIVPRPEGYRNTGRSSAPPPKPPASSRLLRRDDESEDTAGALLAGRIPVAGAVPVFSAGSQVNPAPVNLAPVTPPRPSGSALMPMRMIEVKADYREARSVSEPPAGQEAPNTHEPFGETPNLPPVAARVPKEAPSRPRLSEPPPLPGSLPSAPAHSIPLPSPSPSQPAADHRRPSLPSSPVASSPPGALPRVEAALPSSPLAASPLPSSPRVEPPLPPGSTGGLRVSVEPPTPSSPSFGEPPAPSSRSNPGEPPPLPGSFGQGSPVGLASNSGPPASVPVPSRPAPARIPSRNPKPISGEPPPLPRQPISVPSPAADAGTLAARDENAPSNDSPAQTLRARANAANERSPSELALPLESPEELELESIPPPSVEERNGQVPKLPHEIAGNHSSSAGDTGNPEAGLDLPIGRRSFPGASPSAHQMEPGVASSQQNELAVDGLAPEGLARSRPRPPAPPARARGEGVEMDPGLTVEEPPPTEEQPADSSGDPGRPPPRRRLPRTPPPRTGFTGASEEDSTKRRHWWDEIFSDDFLRAEFELTESQFLDEVNFIQESLAVEKGGLVLDLACGNGRHAIELTRRGYTVVGYDLSLSQLARAGERAQRSGVKVSLLHGDMRELAFEPTFDGIFCWNAGFGYFEEEKNQAVLRNVFRALKPGGTFLLDIPNRDFVVSQQPNQNWFEGDGCVCMDDMQVDFITSRLVVKRTIMLDDGRNRECTFSIRLYGLHELGRILHEAGFRVAEVTGHIAMRGVFMGATSPRLILVVIKP